MFASSTDRPDGTLGIVVDSRFLKKRGLGVLGLTKGSEAYTIPSAFAYGDAADRWVLRFIMTEDSRKRAFVSETEIASLTAYEWRRKNNWRSVVSGDRSS
ncbi:hypothetical protein [Halalkalicoccus ordinarius]|uniref:hypothetical protein n=1 Tax=Halalkalicoccus ordinarius TaxID=3116651 RepID=UPI00300ED0DE